MKKAGRGALASRPALNKQGKQNAEPQVTFDLPS
jgi:hypothetical protein